MVKKGLLSLLLATVLACAPAPLISCSGGPSPGPVAASLQDDPDVIFNSVALPTYKVLGKADGASWSGSAVAISGLRLVTAAHVVTDMANQPVQDGLIVYSELGKTKYVAQAKVIVLLVKYDLAIIEVNVSLPYKAKVATEDEIYQHVKWGERVWVSGHALGVDEPVVTHGVINSLNDSNWIRYTAPQIYGNSGGPVYSFSPSRGFVLTSIAQAGYTAGAGMVTHMSLGVNPITLYEFIRSVS